MFNPYRQRSDAASSPDVRLVLKVPETMT